LAQPETLFSLAAIRQRESKEHDLEKQYLKWACSAHQNISPTVTGSLKWKKSGQRKKRWRHIHVATAVLVAVLQLMSKKYLLPSSSYSSAALSVQVSFKYK